MKESGYAVLNVMLPVTSCSGGSVMVWEGIPLEGHKNLRVIANVTLTTVRCQDGILIAIVRAYADAVGPRFLLVQDNAQPHVARV